MDDFYYILKEHIEQGRLNELIYKWNADPNLTYALSDVPVIVSKDAYYKSKSGKNSLENIFETGRKLGIEVPFAGLFDENDLRVEKFYKGVNGTRHMCYWEKGKLLQNTLQEAEERALDVTLGHAHPVFFTTKGKIARAYGALCSRVYYEKADLKGQLSEMSQELLRTGLYKEYGGDYCEIFLHSLKAHTSTYSWILSPRLNQAGVAKYMADGIVEYHPWIIDEKNKKKLR